MANEESSKRVLEQTEANHENSDSDGNPQQAVCLDIGPLPPSSAEIAPKKKRKVLAHEKLYLDQLPSSDMYERSFMHRDVLNNVVVTSTDFLITTSVDGHLKFWKKTEKGIEFVKHFRAHLGAITGVSISADGLLFATISVDKSLKVFDVINFAKRVFVQDMINMIKLDYVPGCVCWMHKRGQAQALLGCADQNSNTIYMYDGRGSNKPLSAITSIHANPVIIMKYNEKYDCVVSSDNAGFLEYWSPEAPHELPKSVDFQYKSETDLYEFKKSKTVPTSINFSPDFSQFVVLSVQDRQIRVFKFATAKMIRKYDESLTVVSEMQQAGTAVYKLDDMEFGRRLAVEREMEKTPQIHTMNAVFDESGHFIMYPTLLGIKVVNIHSNKVVRVIGKSETHRFLNLSLYQGAPRKKAAVSLAMAASDNPTVKESETLDPTLFCTAYKRNRFYLFTRRDPDKYTPFTIGLTRRNTNRGDRDVFNEKPSREEQTVAVSQSKAALSSSAILRTTMGDIHLRLFPEHAPKAVENFITHSKKGYYDNVIFHRVIKGFMIQTGDPLGDGTGGESIWGNDFEDEFHRELRHDRPYTLSMANAGPNTNGSQFFITVVPTPWLDNKHTVFGRAVAGMDVVHAIENARADKMDKPYEDIQILNIEIR
ncbi:peptidyl-prolyl cis-trans isomerase cyp15 [Basidiobolus meristosporus CBS 931.73]|uniref:peptidylprolyl isomerase n=1 Tax=Basidiobolus meristosporus CBS 931.73 TaxID=1314790 RepID=A0A1Y1XDT9_9FUNG|nr:peptidyl-prolyl cis-trans isomerase cyp15 [Basidiobolus meristosporus CBS 931.73]|eukprot:ORX83909.1 peptidyl-prolyl cis-trans isomerase cyp15 [Basidiobolus meristosporus CBS 931.73]